MEKSLDIDADNRISVHYPDLYHYFMRWNYLYCFLYCVYITRRIMNILVWWFSKDPRLYKARLKVLTMLFLNSSEIILGIVGVIFKNKVHKLVDIL